MASGTKELGFDVKDNEIFKRIKESRTKTECYLLWVWRTVFLQVYALSTILSAKTLPLKLDTRKFNINEKRNVFYT